MCLHCLQVISGQAEHDHLGRSCVVTQIIMLWASRNRSLNEELVWGDRNHQHTLAGTDRNQDAKTCCLFHTQNCLQFLNWTEAVAHVHWDWWNYSPAFGLTIRNHSELWLSMVETTHFYRLYLIEVNIAELWPDYLSTPDQGHRTLTCIIRVLHLCVPCAPDLLYDHIHANDN